MTEKRLHAARPAEKHLELEWQDGDGPRSLTWFWLRDHCPCPECLHPETLQRQVDSLVLMGDLQYHHGFTSIDPDGDLKIRAWEFRIGLGFITN